MKKIIKWVYANALFLVTLFLLAFIPLYPKLPLVDVKNTWVYIRAEDFVIFLVLLIYTYFLIKKKITLNTPLTIPILAFWIIGGIATIHGVLLLFPTIANIFPNVALLSYVRHIEYVSVFFIAFAGMRRKDFLKTVIAVLSIVFIVACLYGLGQKYASLPAFLTMNEEFAKGIPITLSQLSRVPSTFAGHYDFAAYLALCIPIFAALFFGVRNIILKVFFGGTVLLGLLLMFMTVSRVSFFAVLVSLGLVLFILKRKLVLISIPIVIILGVLVTFTQSSLFARFGNTVKEVDVLVNGKTGAAIGNVEYVPVTYLYDKSVKVQRVDDEEKLNQAIQGDVKEEASVSGIIKKLPLPYELLPKDAMVPLVKASNISNGEVLPQGTGYINLSLSPVKTRVGDFYYELSPNISSTDVVNFHGNFIVKKASAYDLSFTTRFQGEWPNAINAFMRNIFFGSGYGSVSLAIDNNFLRMLAEIGLLGTSSFILLFVVVGIYAYKSYKYIDSRLVKTFVVGVCAGIIGLALNATLIDVFEASKVAFTLWLLVGITLAVLVMESSKKINIKTELISFLTSPFAMGVYLLAVCVFLYASIIEQFFTLKDFNVFYHSIACGQPTQCFLSSVKGYLLGVSESEAPLVTLYFALMYKFFWLNQVVYHISSIMFNFGMSILVFVFAQKILKNTLLSMLAGFVFLVSASTFQSTASISHIGIIASSLFVMLGFLLYTKWEEKRNKIILGLAIISGIISLLFGVVGVALPLLVISHSILIRNNKLTLSSVSFWILSVPTIAFVVTRLIGSVSYMHLNEYLSLPWILFVNALISIPAIIVGENLNSIAATLYSLSSMAQIVLSFVLFVAVIILLYLANRKHALKNYHVRLITFLSVFFFVASLPFGIQKDIFSQSVYLSIVSWCIAFSLVFYGLYVWLRGNGKTIAIGFIGVGIITYSLFQIIQIQGFYKNNHTSSELVKKFLVSIDSLYSNSWAKGEVNFYFLNTPSEFLQTSKSQSSLESVLWLVFQNPQLSAHVVDNPENARQYANSNPNSYIFMFNDDKSISEIPKFEVEVQ